MKKVFGVLIVLAFVGSICFAQGMGNKLSATVKSSAVAEAGNKICPVMGGKVSGENFYEYNGKRYGLCCPACEAAFKADPSKYSAIADKEAPGK